MDINLVDTVVAPFGSGYVLGPMMIWPPANGFIDTARAALASSSTKASEITSAAICLPDLSAENPFA
jgi:hypothetical protein